MSDELTVGDITDYLEHHGVKGMHWGHHSSQASGSSGSSGSSGGRSLPTRAELRAKNRVDKAKAKVAQAKSAQKESDARDSTILKARENLGKSQGKLNVAKAQYKVDKHIKGRAAAKAVLKNVKNDHMLNVHNANLETAKETVDRQKRERAETAVRLLNNYASSGSIHYSSASQRDAAQQRAATRFANSW